MKGTFFGDSYVRADACRNIVWTHGPIQKPDFECTVDLFDVGAERQDREGHPAGRDCSFEICDLVWALELVMPQRTELGFDFTCQYFNEWIPAAPAKDSKV